LNFSLTERFGNAIGVRILGQKSHTEAALRGPLTR
jgi:hypothetical protein